MLPAFVINLDRSRDRWAMVSESAVSAGLDLERVPAVDAGSMLESKPYPGLDEQMFMRYHGRTVLLGEYG